MINYFQKISFLILALCATLAIAQPNWHAQLAGSYGYSKVDGFIQIPIGGKPGTTTQGKPDLSDIGINNDNLWKLNLDLFYGKWGGVFSYENQQDQGNALLKQNLVTHGIPFAAGTDVDSDVKFDLWDVGGVYDILHNQFTFQPILALTTLDFSYQLTSRATSTNRHFSQFTPRVGLNVIYHVNNKLKFTLGGLSSIPRLTNLAVYTAVLKSSYVFYKIKHTSLSVFAGLKYQQIHFKDKQIQPNEIKITNWPMGFVGLSIEI